MKNPDFSSWVAWHDRDTLDNIIYPGIYALAVTEKILSGHLFQWQCEISYFGMTNSLSGLRGRLKQFDNTINGKTGHGGAERFMHDYKVSGKLMPLLYVSVWPFKCNVRAGTPKDLMTMGCVAKAEYECFSRCLEIFKKLPKYNDKKSSPKHKKVTTNIT